MRNAAAAARMEARASITFVIESERMTPTLVLASNSPRRKQLLAITGWTFGVRPVDVDESPFAGEAPDLYVLRLARMKAQAAALNEGEVILTADTTVADGTKILGKPADADEARAMLRDLRGRRHTVYTAIGVRGSLADARADGDIVTDLCAAQVWMRDYSDAEIEAYIASGDPFDKAGAYAIQHADFHPAERVEGCYACVMGLPVCHVVRALEQYGLAPLPAGSASLENTCPEQLAIDSPCPAFEEILRTGI